MQLAAASRESTGTRLPREAMIITISENDPAAGSLPDLQ
jgi:hypothetical protein